MSHQIVNSAMLAFFRKPKEMLPIISKLFGVVLEGGNESPIVASKCAHYYGLLQDKPEALERQFIEFSQRVYDVVENTFSPTQKDINSLVLIYQKPAETFTRDSGYFSMQRWGDKDEGVRNAGGGEEKQRGD